MKIRFSKIPAESGLPISDSLSLEALNARMDEADSNEITFLTAPLMSLTIHKRVQGAEIEGTVTTSYRQPCARCADEVEQPLTISLQLELKQSNGDPEEFFEDDVGIVIIHDENIPLEEIIQEHLILALSPALFPDCHANGDCSLCGRSAAGSDAHAGHRY